MLKLTELGLQHTDKGLKIIDTILSQMNNKRLSSSGYIKVDRALLQSEIDKLLSEPSNYEYRQDGTIYIKSLNRKYSVRGKGRLKVIIQDTQKDLVLYTFDSLCDCAKFLGISQLSRRLHQSKPFLFENTLVCIKRV